MTTLVGGIIALILGLLGLIYWWEPFIILLQAGIPLILILGGALATYLGIEEWKDSQAAMEAEGSTTFDAEAERYRAEAEKYRAELEALKNQQGSGEEAPGEGGEEQKQE